MRNLIECSEAWQIASTTLNSGQVRFKAPRSPLRINRQEPKGCEFGDILVVSSVPEPGTV